MDSTDEPTRAHVHGPTSMNSQFLGRSSSDDVPVESSPLLPADVPRRLRIRLPLMNLFDQNKSAKLYGSTSGPKGRVAPPGTPQDGSSTINEPYTPDTYPNTPVAGPSRVPSRSPGPERESWKRRARSRIASSPHLNLRLENSGSVARDHLASERTFLAYVRTSLVIASTGVGLVQLFTISATSSTKSADSGVTTTTLVNGRIQVFARPLGATTVVFALIVLLIGVFRYFAIQTALTQGKFPAARVSVAFLSVALSALVVTVFGILVGARR